MQCNAIRYDTMRCDAILQEDQHSFMHSAYGSMDGGARPPGSPVELPESAKVEVHPHILHRLQLVGSWNCAGVKLVGGAIGYRIV